MRIDAMTPTLDREHAADLPRDGDLPAGLHQRRVRLTREPSSAAEARSQVREVIRAWKIPVDPDIAILLTSDLVTNAIRHGDGETVTLGIRCSRGHLRVDVYDSPRPLPAQADGADGPVDAEIGRGLVLVAALSTEWGSFRTPAGKAVYFTLAFQPELPWDGDHAAPGVTRGDGEP
jgi:histidine kinase-like protein